MANAIARAYVQVQPSMKGFRKSVMSDMDAAGKTGVGRLKSTLSKGGVQAGKDFSKQFKSSVASGDFGEGALAKLETALNRAKGVSNKATRAMEDDKSRLAIANQRLADAEAKYGKNSTQAKIAAEKVAMAERKAAESKEAARVASAKLTDAEKALKSAQDAAAKGAETGAAKTGSAFSRLKDTVVKAFSSFPGASAMKSLFEPLTSAASGLKDKLSGGLSKAWNLLPEGFRNAASKAANFVGEHLSSLAGKAGSVFSAVSSTVGSAFSSMASAAGTVLSGLATAAAGAATAAAAAVGSIVKSSVDSFAQYEQLTGGMEKLFGDAGQSVVANAKNAFRTAGISANQYMQNATSFASSLVEATGGDTRRAAELADMAMRDMSDNANTFGRSVEDITAAYQSLARGNAGMLDNLSLPFKGTKSELERMMGVAGETWKSVTGEDRTFDSTNFADIVEAIHVVQGGLGDASDAANIYGTTMREGSNTVEGSMNQMKASWENFKTSLGTGEDTAGAFQNFTDSASTYLQNLVPVVGQIFSSLGETIRTNLEKAFPGFTEKMESIKTKVEEIVGYIGPRVQSLWESVKPWIESAWELIQNIGGAIWNVLSPAIDLIGNGIAVVMDVLSGLFTFLQPVWDWLMEKLGGLFSFVGEVIGGIVGWVADLVADLRSKIDNIGQAIEGFKLMWQALKNKIWEVIKSVASTIGGWVNSVRTWFSDVANTVRAKMNSFRDSCRNAVNSVVEFFTGLPGKIKSAVSGAATWLLQTGKDMVSGLINGLGNIATAVYNKIKGGISSAIDSVKGWLGIGSPSRRMAAVIGVPMAQGVAMGFGWETNDMAADINRDMQDAVRQLVTVPVNLAGSATWRAAGASAPTPPTVAAAHAGGRVVYQTINVTATDPASVLAVLQARERVALGV